MTWRRLIPVAIVVVLAAATVGYVHLIPLTQIERQRLATLVVTTPPSGFTKKPASSTAVPASSSPFATVKTAGKTAPNSTGSYSIQWNNPTSSNDSAWLLVSLLPSAADAAKVQSEAASQYLGSESFKTENYTLAGNVPVPSVPGAQAAVYQSSKNGPPVVTVIYHVDRAQVVAFVGLVGSQSKATSTATTLAAAEAAQLDQVLPGFTLSKTSWPAVASALYWLAILSVVLIVVAIPIMIRRTRQRRIEARQRMERRQLQSRGRKVARRGATRYH
jgi:hypothetical protein